MKRKKGFTLVEIMIVVLIIGLLAALAIPNFIKARNVARRNACINNLRQIESAKDQLAMEYGLDDGQAVTAAGAATEEAALQPYIKGNVFPECPVRTGAYTIGNIGTRPACSLTADPHYHILPDPVPADLPTP